MRGSKGILPHTLQYPVTRRFNPVFPVSERSTHPGFPVDMLRISFMQSFGFHGNDMVQSVIEERKKNQ
jgi:hypothetical protein